MVRALTSRLRDAILAKFAHARAHLEQLRGQWPAALERERTKGYLAALKDLLALEGLNRRRRSRPGLPPPPQPGFGPHGPQRAEPDRRG